MASSIMIVSFLTLLIFIYNEVRTKKKAIWQRSHTKIVTGVYTNGLGVCPVVGAGATLRTVAGPLERRDDAGRGL